MGRNWTADQLDAIVAKWRDEEKTKSSNILVNAAAGSGKTAVLVERIINKICSDPDSSDHVDIDNLLVVTFTNAAAMEMQQRIADSLQKNLTNAELDNDTIAIENLSKQISLLDFSDITTIDSFCLKLVKNYFHLLEIDPDFSIIDNAQLSMLKDDALEQLYEENFDKDEFINLLSLYSDNRDESGLGEIILKIFNFTRSVPNPYNWLYSKADIFNSKEGRVFWLNVLENNIDVGIKKSIETLSFSVQKIYNYVYNCEKNLSIGELYEWLKANGCCDEIEAYKLFSTYYEAIRNEFICYNDLLTFNLEKKLQEIKKIDFIRLNAASKLKDKSYIVKEKEILSILKTYRDLSKETFKSEVRKYADLYNENDFSNICEEIHHQVKSLCDFTIEFENIYNQLKSLKNGYEFSDIEHLTYRLLNENPDVCCELQNKYSEILMDEYQDSNQLQEEIFNKISRGDNIFLVGDMKQSIYRFRNSDPSLFKNKCLTYKKDKNELNRKIVLSKNFRSRKEILNSVNSVFSAIMSEASGEIEYDDDQKLYYGDVSYQDMNITEYSNYKSECHIVLNSKSEEDIIEKLSDAELEAVFVAKKIIELKNNRFLVRDKIKVKDVDGDGNVIEKEEDLYRPIQNKDIAIILSAAKNVSKTFCDVLSSYGIECYAFSGGYYEKPEIRLILTLLKAINNPYNDLSFIGTMRSFVFGITDDELCEIRKKDGNTFYDTVKNFLLDADENSTLYKKCKYFIKKLDDWKRYTKYMSSDKLIWTIYEECNMFAFCNSIYGPESCENLRLLFTKAKDFEITGYKGLFNFIRYIDKLKLKEDDNSSAISQGDEDIVKIITIHKSKGLEFPVVFAPRCAKAFNLADTKGRILLDKELGFGPDYINYQKSYYNETLFKKAVVDKIKRENIAEEMRKLYVLMTRAKEKLIVSAISSGDENGAKHYESWANSVINSKMPECFSSGVNNYIDWIAPVAINDKENWKFNVLKYSDVINDYSKELSSEEDININETEPIINFCDDEYSFSDDIGIDVKVSVSEINRMKNNLSDEVIKVPDFYTANSDIATPLQRGTATHLVLQKYVPKPDFSINEINQFIQKLFIENELTQEEKNSVDANTIYNFYNSDLGKRILASPKVFREIPFEMEIPASEVYDTNSRVKIMLQGIIDCCFYEDNEMIIVDYKTDRSTDVEYYKRNYKNQLNYYKRAVEEVLNVKVKETYLYLLNSSFAIKL